MVIFQIANFDFNCVLESQLKVHDQLVSDGALSSSDFLKMQIVFRKANVYNALRLARKFPERIACEQALWARYSCSLNCPASTRFVRLFSRLPDMALVKQQKRLIGYRERFC
ncbi:MAG TPA: hypothetical protein DD666_04210 [Advenella kashmirensis]|uniref:Uncharacterized protein n=1 Tax=Advenella kashmirensis TaxID=310575 RepID=A0A356LDG6_9BURK|nr:hypothetical protein [Advenella kashmirensis]